MSWLRHGTSLRDSVVGETNGRRARRTPGTRSGVRWALVTAGAWLFFAIGCDEAAESRVPEPQDGGASSSAAGDVGFDETEPDGVVDVVPSVRLVEGTDSTLTLQ